MTADEDRLKAFLHAFERAFGSRAMEVAVMQLENATGEPMLVWREIVSRLAASDSHLHPV
jgi:hypothetical protein